MYLDIDESKGIQNAIGLPSHEVERLEGEDKTNPNYVQYQWNSAGLTLENWQMAHFRILGKRFVTHYKDPVFHHDRRALSCIRQWGAPANIGPPSTTELRWSLSGSDIIESRAGSLWPIGMRKLGSNTE